MQLSSCYALESQNNKLDSRITDSMIYKQLNPLELWQRGFKPTDETERWSGCVSGISNTPGGWNAYRAKNLAANRHYAEAIDELTTAIAEYEKPGRINYSVDPNLLLRRAKLFKLLGMDTEALADIKRAANTKKAIDGVKFRCAKALVDYEEYDQAEAILKPIVSSGMTLFRSCFYYLLGFCQEQQNKKRLAIESYKTAADLFAANGNSLSAQACFDRLSILKGSENVQNPASKGKLSRPNSNMKNIKRLIKK